MTNIIRGAYGYEFYTPEFESQEEVELLKDFSALIQDYDLVLEDDLSIGFQAEFDLKEQISILESNGFWVFEKQIKKKYKINNEIQVWPIAAIQIVRETDSSIIKICFDDLKKEVK